MLPKTKVVIIDEPVVVLSEAEDSVQAVADSVGGATRRRGSEAAEAVHEGARHNKAKEEPKKVILFIIKKCNLKRTLTNEKSKKVHVILYIIYCALYIL